MISPTCLLCCGWGLTVGGWGEGEFGASVRGVSQNTLIVGFEGRKLMPVQPFLKSEEAIAKTPDKREKPVSRPLKGPEKPYGKRVVPKGREKS